MMESMSLLIHAGAKVGKTTLAATAPLPQLVIDAEGGTKYLPLSHYLRSIYGRPLVIKQWHPAREPIPRYDGTWDIQAVVVQQWTDVVYAYQRLLTEDHDFQSLSVDSITEIQRRCKQNLKGSEALKIQDWGTLLTEMDGLIRGFRDLTLHPVRPIRVVVFIAETRQTQGKWKPYMQGQIEIALPYWMDGVGYLYAETAQDQNGQQTAGGVNRRLLIGPHPMYESGSRFVEVLGYVVDNPNIYRMYTQLFGEQIFGEQTMTKEQD